MKIGLKLGIGFGVLIVALVVIVLFAINGMSNINDEVDDMANDKFPKTIWANNIIDALNMAAKATRTYAVADDPRIIKEAEQTMKEAASLATENQNKLKETIKSEKGKELLANYNTVRNEQYYPARQKFFDLLNSGQKDAAIGVLVGELKQAEANYFQAITDLITYQNELVEKGATNAEEAFSSAQTLMFIIAGIAIVVAIILAIFIITSITKPLSRAVDASEEIGNGNLNVDLDTEAKDETG